MSWFSRLFGTQKSAAAFRQVDWSAVDAKLHELKVLTGQTDQASAKHLIIQADILVDVALKQAKVPGQTMGERLKSLKGKISSAVYHQLWQAHLKRNELVHDAGSFVADWEKKQYFEAFQAGLNELRRSR